MSRRAKGYQTLLVEELADYFAFVFVVDASEEFRTECLNRFRTIERQLVINLPATKVTRLTFRFQDWFDVSGKIDLVVT